MILSIKALWLCIKIILLIMLQHSEGAFRIFPHRLESLTEALHPPLWSDFVALRDEPLVVAPIAEYVGALVRLRLTKGVKLGERRLSMNVGIIL